MPDYNKVKWFSFPFVAPKGKGSRPEPAQGEIMEIDPPAELRPCKACDDPLRFTPAERRQRIIELWAEGFKRWLAKQESANSP